MNQYTITFSPDGIAHCLWTEAVPLHELGRLEITRATNIEFNNATQHWEVKDRKGQVRFFAKSRSACLEWEQQNLRPDQVLSQAEVSIHGPPPINSSSRER